MKKIKFSMVIVGLLFIICLFGSCLTLLDAAASGNKAVTSESKPKSSDWVSGRFVNEWGDKTNDYFIEYRYNIRGTLSNVAVQNGVMSARNVTFSKLEGLSIDLHDHDSDSSRFANVDSADVIIKIGDSDYKFNARVSGLRTVRIDYSQKLLDLFLLEKDMLFRITTKSELTEKYTKSGNSYSYYQFTLRPGNFSTAFYETINR